MFETLFEIIEDRKLSKPGGSYTSALMASGENKILRKIGEEALEVTFASKDEGRQRLVEEASDLIYHLFVLLSFKGVDIDEVKQELLKRHQGEL